LLNGAAGGTGRSKNDSLGRELLPQQRMMMTKIHRMKILAKVLISFGRSGGRLNLLTTSKSVRIQALASFTTNWKTITTWRIRKRFS